MKLKLIIITAILLFLFVAGFSFAQYHSGNVFEQKEISKKEDLSKNNELNLNKEESKNQKCDSSQDKFQQALYCLESFRVNGSLDELIIQWDKIEQNSGKLGGDFYGNLSLKFLSILTSTRYRSADDKALNLSQDYAIQALEKADTFDLETEWQLLNYLRYPLTKDKLNNSQIQERRERVKLWLHALHRLKTEKDEDFDPNDLPVLNVTPPKGIRVRIAGMSPEAIEDPKLRAEYEKAIAANAKKADYRTKQFLLRQNESSIVKDAVKYISEMYSQPPANLQELDKLLNDYNISESLREEISNQTESLIESRKVESVL